MKTKVLILSLLAPVLYTGCGRQPAAAPPPPSVAKPSAGMPALNAASDAVPPPGAPAAVAMAPQAAGDAPTYDGKDEADRLTKALQDYYTRHGAMAPVVTSVDGLVKAGLIKTVPAAPAGKKYVIDTKTVTVRLE